MGDVLPLVTAHTLGTDLQPHDQGVDGLVHGPVILLDPVHHISIDLCVDKGCVVLGAQVTLLNGTNWNWATAVCPWLGEGGRRDGPGLRGWRHPPKPSAIQTHVAEKNLKTRQPFDSGTPLVGRQHRVRTKPGDSRAQL